MKLCAVVEEIINLEHLCQEMCETCSVSFILRSRKKMKNDLVSNIAPNCLTEDLKELHHSLCILKI